MWCEISRPAQFPPLYDLTDNKYNFDDFWPVSMVYAAEDVDGIAGVAANNTVRQPDLAAALRDPRVVNGLEVRGLASFAAPAVQQ